MKTTNLYFNGTTNVKGGDTLFVNRKDCLSVIKAIISSDAYQKGEVKASTIESLELYLRAYGRLLRPSKGPRLQQLWLAVG